MTLLTFNGTEWTRKPTGHGHILDTKVVFKNDTSQYCHLTFDPPATFGIDSTNLAALSEIHLPLGKHLPTKCKAFGPAGVGVTETI